MTECCAHSRASKSPLRGLHASVPLTRLMSGCKCGPSTRWKLNLHGPSVTWNWQPTENRYSLPTESFVGPPCTCSTYKPASTWPHARTLKLTLTSSIQPCIQPSSTLPPFASIQSNVSVVLECTRSPSIISCRIVPFSRKRNHKRRRLVHRGPRSSAIAIDSWKLQNYQRIYNILQCPGVEKMSHPIYLT